jgi:hypothetical protein
MLLGRFLVLLIWTRIQYERFNHGGERKTKDRDGG